MRPTLIPAALVAVLALSGCGTADDDAASASDQAKARDAALKFARCMREHGIDIPDPGTGEDGGFIRVGPGKRAGREDITPAKFEKAEKACAKYRDAVRPQLSEKDQEEFRKRALAHAKCMREQGLDFPDPQFGEGGQATVRIGRGPGAVDPDRAKFRKANEVCAKELGGGPGGGEGPAFSVGAR